MLCCVRRELLQLRLSPTSAPTSAAAGPPPPRQAPQPRFARRTRSSARWTGTTSWTGSAGAVPPRGSQHWISVFDKRHVGICETSTNRLRLLQLLDTFPGRNVRRDSRPCRSGDVSGLTLKRMLLLTRMLPFMKSRSFWRFSVTTGKAW